MIASLYLPVRSTYAHPIIYAERQRGSVFPNHERATYVWGRCFKFTRMTLVK